MSTNKKANNEPDSIGPQDTPAAIKTSAPTFQHVDHDHPSLISPLDGNRIDLGRYKNRLNKNRLKHNYEYDAIVLGAGPAGEAAARERPSGD